MHLLVISIMIVHVWYVKSYNIELIKNGNKNSQRPIMLFIKQKTKTTFFKKLGRLQSILFCHFVG